MRIVLLQGGIISLLSILVLYKGINRLSLSQADSTKQQAVIHLRGLIAGCVIFLIFGGLYIQQKSLKSSLLNFLRNLIFHFSILYLLFLCFLFFQDTSHIREILNFLHSDAGLPLPSKTYAQDCRIFTPQHPHSNYFNISNAMDFYLTAHSLGWFVKMLIIRDVRLAVIIGLLFEFIEFLYEPWLPNFGECWWDHWVLDMFICNGMGIFIAYYVLRFFKMPFYDWTDDLQGSDKVTRRNHSICVSHFIELFHWKKWLFYRWKMFKEFKWFIGAVLIATFTLLLDLNNFFGKKILWIPHDSPLLVLRASMWGFCSIEGTSRLFKLVVRQGDELGGQFFIIAFGSVLQLAIIFQSYSGQFKKTLDPLQVNIWAGSLVALGLYGVGLFGKMLGRK